MSRIGLHQLSTSARNSPFGNEKAIFESKKSSVEPLKLNQKTLKKYQPITPSPLAASSTPVHVFEGENKENAETQTVESYEIAVQTEVSINHVAPTIAPEDLCSEEPTANYLQVLADRLQEELEDEKVRNLQLVKELGDLDEQLQKIDDETEILMEVLEEIDAEQTD